jgi:tetratricopeptide (TPR) repeat protein
MLLHSFIHPMSHRMPDPPTSFPRFHPLHPLRSAGPVLALLPLLALAGGCSSVTAGTRSFDSNAYLREQIEERVGFERAASLPIPFQVTDDIVAASEGRINRGASERVRTEQITDFIFGYLGLQYELTPTRSAIETFRDREGNCLSFVNLFVGLAREYRLSPFYVEVEDYQRWNYNDGLVVSHGHIVAGMRVDGHLETFDFLPYRTKSYRDFNPIDDLKATAHYYNNLAAEALMRGDLDRAREHSEIAYGLAPWFEKVANNLGVVLIRQGEVERALGLLSEALAEQPTNVPLLTNTARAYQELGRLDEANELLTRLEGLQEANPYFYVYRGEVALAQNDFPGALEYMRKALRQDSENPQVHVGLVKVYLAMGDREKALHHVERALRLDATYEEARKYAAILSRTAGSGSN